jgi:F0F1-type ATP synthase membrane subunit c/vacuolar-type H+-ATPase subunit K
MNTERPATSVERLPVLYAALASGVFLYAVVLVFVLEPTGAVADSTWLRIAWLAVAVGVTLMAGVIQARLRSPSVDESGRVSSAILIWALAEGQAFLGLTGYLLSGDRMLLILSLVLFAYLYLRYPPAAFTRRSR